MFLDHGPSRNETASNHFVVKECEGQDRLKSSDDTQLSNHFVVKDKNRQGGLESNDDTQRYTMIRSDWPSTKCFYDRAWRSTKCLPAF